MDIIGTKFIIWLTDYRSGAYKDQVGISHSAYVVLNEYEVEIIETRKVKGVWGNDEYDGWKAEDKKGNIFTNNWHSFPDDSMTPCYYWDCIEIDNEVYMPEDAVSAYNSGRAYVREDGTRAVPPGVIICKNHDRARLPDGRDHCIHCFSDDVNEYREKHDERGHLPVAFYDDYPEHAWMIGKETK